MDYLEEYYDNVKKRSLNSFKISQNVLMRFFNYIQKNPEDVKRSDVKDYLKNIVDNWNVKLKTKSLHYALLSSFYSWLTEELNEDEIVFINPVPKKYVRNFTTNPNDFEDEDDANKKVLSKEQIEQILDYTRNNRKMRDFILVGLQICTGARVSEIRTIRISNVNLKERSFKTGIEINARKSSKHGLKKLKFIFPKKFKIYLEYYLNTLDPNQKYLFSTYNQNKCLNNDLVYYIYNQIREKIGFYFTSHFFRHSIITYLEENGCPVNISNRLLNHKISGTQERVYKHFDRVKDYDKYFPYYLSKYF